MKFNAQDRVLRLCNVYFQWCQLSARKNNLKRLFEQMQTYQYNKLRENPDKPLDEDERILEQDDVERS